MMNSSASQIYSLPADLCDGTASPLDQLIAREERAFIETCLVEVASENRLGLEAKYGLGDYSSILDAARNEATTRTTLYNQHERELIKMRLKLLESGLV